jgi:hypothetical protein
MKGYCMAHKPVSDAGGAAHYAETSLTLIWFTFQNFPNPNCLGCSAPQPLTDRGNCIWFDGFLVMMCIWYRIPVRISHIPLCRILITVVKVSLWYRYRYGFNFINMGFTGKSDAFFAEGFLLQ